MIIECYCVDNQQYNNMKIKEHIIAGLTTLIVFALCFIMILIIH